MAVSFRHALSQGPVLGALARAALSGARPKRSAPVETPGPWFSAEVPPRPEGLIRDYVKNVGGDPAWYRGAVPPHLFPQWGFPLAARALAGLPYPLARVMNAGCRIECLARLPANEPLLVRARIESVDDDGRRAIVTQRIVTGTRSAPEAVVADLRAFIPLEKAEKGARTAKARPTVPEAAHELAYLLLLPNAGLDFAKLTGDFNPIHWLGPYARAAGFRACILHGFATLARAIEALNRGRFSGDPSMLSVIDARFTAPLVLPAKVGVYVSNGGDVWIGDAPGGNVYLEGRFETKAGS